MAKASSMRERKISIRKVCDIFVVGDEFAYKILICFMTNSNGMALKREGKKTIALMTLMMKNFFFAYEISKNLLALS